MRKLLFIFALSILVLLQPVYGEENFSVRKVTILHIIPFDIAYPLFEYESYDNIGSKGDFGAFKFNVTTRKWLNETLYELNQNGSIDTFNIFSVSYSFRDKNHPEFSFILYPNMLISFYKIADKEKWLNDSEYSEHMSIAEDFIRSNLNKFVPSFKDGSPPYTRNIYPQFKNTRIKYNEGERTRIVFIEESSPKINESNLELFHNFFPSSYET